MPSTTDAAAATPQRVLPLIVLAQFAGTSPWFAVNAVMPELQRQFGWPAQDIGLLSSAVQAGFIAGTLVFALLALADRFPARAVFVCCACASAACTVAAAVSAGSFTALWAWRASTGFFLAGIYPVGMKLAAMWFPQGLGRALGLLVGALVVGTASPHALRAVGAAWPWQAVFVGVTLLSLGAAAAVAWGLPDPPGRRAGAAGGLHFTALSSLWTDARVRASALGYFGHMWELYTLWVLLPLILATRLRGAALSWAAFAVVAAGAIGCVAGGAGVARLGSARVAAIQLALSGACCLAAPWLIDAPGPLFACWLLVWGITVAGDSPQFSALTATNAPRHAVGSVLTLVNSIGFAISAISLLVFAEAAREWPLASLLPWLAPGPLLGLWALRPLWRQQR